MIPRVNLLDALIIKDIFGPSLLKNCLNRAATGSDKESSSSIVSNIKKPKYFDGWDIRTSFVSCYCDCLIKVLVNVIDELMLMHIAHYQRHQRC